jgi:hypothetical protein
VKKSELREKVAPETLRAVVIFDRNNWDIFPKDITVGVRTLSVSQVADARFPILSFAVIMSGPDALFNVHNNFYLGAYQMAITEASSANNLAGNDAADRDCYLYRSYIALGSYQVCVRM